MNKINKKLLDYASLKAAGATMMGLTRTYAEGLAMIEFAEQVLLEDKQLQAALDVVMRVSKKRRDDREIRHRAEAKVWGPERWLFLHTFCKRADVEDLPEELINLTIEEFVASLKCGPCKADFAKLVKENPPVKGQMLRWSIDRHNQVSEKVGNDVMSYELAESLY